MQKNPVKVLFVTEDFYPSFIGGQGVWGKELVEEIGRQGVSMTVLAEDRAGRAAYWQKRKNIRLVLVPFCFGNQVLLASLSFLHYYKHLRGKKFGIIHTNQLTGLFFVLFRPQGAGRIIVSVHNTWDQIAKSTSSWMKRAIYTPLIFLESVVFRRADGLLFHTEDERQYVQKRYGVFDIPSDVIAPGAPRVSYTSKDHLNARRRVRHELSLPSDARILLYVGRLARRKGIDHILTATRGIKNCYAVIIGKGQDRGRLERMAPANVRFLGYMSDISDYFLAADVFVTISKAEGGVALSVLEAAAYELPLVVSREAASGVVKPGVNGYIVNPEDREGVVKALTRACAGARRMGIKSRMLVKTFTWERCVSKILQWYQFVVSTV